MRNRRNNSQAMTIWALAMILVIVAPSASFAALKASDQTRNILSKKKKSEAKLKPQTKSIAKSQSKSQSKIQTTKVHTDAPSAAAKAAAHTLPKATQSAESVSPRSSTPPSSQGPEVATTSASLKSVTSDPTKEPKTAGLSGSFNSTRSTSLYDFKDGTRADTMDYLLLMGVGLSPYYSLSLQAAYSQNLHDSKENDFADTAIGLGRKASEWGKYILAKPSVIVIAPTSKASKTQQNLQAGLRLSGSFALNPTVNPNLTLSLALLGGPNFYAYETDINGAVLNKYSFKQIFTAGYSFGDFSLTGIFIHKNGISFQNKLSESFEHYQELGYSINKTFSVAVGHTNSGSALKPNGTDSNLALINEHDSIVYGTLTLAF